MYAVVDCRGEQIRVAPGERVDVPFMEGEPGAKVTLDRVLLLQGEKLTIGTPVVEGASVSGTIAEQTRDSKITVFKFRRRTKYRRTRGHRQPRTVLQIEAIDA